MLAQELGQVRRPAVARLRLTRVVRGEAAERQRVRLAQDRLRRLVLARWRGLCRVPRAMHQRLVPMLAINAIGRQQRSRQSLIPRNQLLVKIQVIRRVELHRRLAPKRRSVLRQSRAASREDRCEAEPFRRIRAEKCESWVVVEAVAAKGSPRTGKKTQELRKDRNAVVR